MSTKEMVYSMVDRLNEEQLKALFVILGGIVHDEKPETQIIEEVEPDEWELQMIAESEADDSEPIPIEEYAERLGIDYGSI